MNILITGASGFIGTALAKYLADKHTVICLSRQAPEGAFTYVQGSFDSAEDLSRLDSYDIQAVIHLAAVTGGSTEEESLAVNVLGTRRLYRYLLDHGCQSSSQRAPLPWWVDSLRILFRLSCLSQMIIPVWQRMPMG